MRRSATVTRVPELVGRPVSEAHDAALDAGVLPVDQPPHPATRGSATVIRQQPAAGSAVATGARVGLWISTDPDDPGDPGGGGGGRGGRRPTGPCPLLPAGTK